MSQESELSNSIQVVRNDIIAGSQFMSLILLELQDFVTEISIDADDLRQTNKLHGYVSALISQMLEMKKSAFVDLDFVSHRNRERDDFLKTLKDDAIARIAELEAEREEEVGELKKRIAKLEWRLRDKRTIVHKINDPEVRAKVYEMTGGKCAYCGVSLAKDGLIGETFSVEHVICKNVGGPDHINNYVPSCMSCNTSKGTGHVLSFIEKKVARA